MISRFCSVLVLEVIQGYVKRLALNEVVAECVCACVRACVRVCVLGGGGERVTASVLTKSLQFNL